MPYPHYPPTKLCAFKTASASSKIASNASPTTPAEPAILAMNSPTPLPAQSAARSEIARSA